jgi:hypothetical protein
MVVLIALAPAPVRADVGDPQVRTDHPWYPGELAVSTFERLFATQAEAYRRAVGTAPKTDEERALAAWFWRNTHYYHGEDGRQDLWGKGFGHNENWIREYWTGLFGCGFGLCGTTHHQWTAEMERVLGHARARTVGVEGHTAFEVFLTGGPYGKGKWVLLDHDLSTVIYNREGTALLSVAEIKADLKRLTDRKFVPERQHGWLVSGLHPDDAPGVYTAYKSASYFSGYSGPPPAVHLRRGETLRRHLEPGLEDGKTFVFWGRNNNTGGIPGPERDLTWVNQPEKMHGSREGTPARAGQARYGNAVYTYRPNFAGDYREGVVDEDERHVTFAFQTPYLIGATPPNNKEWGIYDDGCKNGLVLRGKAGCQVAVSLDRGKTWRACGKFRDGLDLTDHVKGRRQYLLRFDAGARDLTDAGLTMITVCQANAAILPRLKDDGSNVHFEASGQAVVSAGPAVDEAGTHVVAGGFQTQEVTLELATPRHESIRTVYAAAHMASGTAPRADVKYFIDCSTDGGTTWHPLVKDWTIPRHGDEPGESWSQSFCYGSGNCPDKEASSIRVRFRNTGGKQCLRAEVHLVYRTKGSDGTKVTFDWTDDAGAHRESHVFDAGKPGQCDIKTGKQVRTRWVEFEAIAAP